jgi:hypothetical protein
MSLLLGLATTALWLRSYFVYDILGREAYSGIGTELISVSGHIIFYRFNSYHGAPPPQEWGFRQLPADSGNGSLIAREYDLSASPRWWNHLGFSAVSRPIFGPGTTFVVLVLPQWFIAIVFMTLSVPWLLRTRALRMARARILAGACFRCGYPLTDNTSGICPECGTAAPEKDSRC